MIEPAVSIRVGGFSAAGGTDPGRVRSENEDRLYFDVDRGIFLVADGVGGNAAGEVAATIAVDVVVQRLERPTWSAEQRVREAIALANNEILKQAQAVPAYRGMTCVMTLAVLTDGRVTIGHVGDSRLYKLTPRGIAKLTHDHSPVGEREDSGEITELEAMQHPRRNEVFRDVGSSFHEPDDPDFIEIVTTTFEPQSALMICSDGLSDLVTSMAIERIVTQHAGDPAAVVAALIEAANEAGGKDNITVVYVEGDRFADTPKRAPARVERIATTRNATRGVSAGLQEEPRSVRHGLDTAMQHVAAFGHAVARSRTAWLTLGVVLGLIIVAGAALWPGLDPLITSRGRVLTVGPVAAQYPTIGAALAAARARDVVQIEPGEYPEAVTVKDGVTMRARVPGTVTLVAPANRSGWVGVSANGHLGAHISGIRILGRSSAPIDVGMRLSGHDVSVDDVALEGTIGVGMDIVNDGSILVHGSRFSGVRGIPMRIGTSARPVIRQNVFERAPSDDEAFALAVSIAGDAAPELSRNTFVGFSEPLGSGARRDHLMHGNYNIRSERP